MLGFFLSLTGVNATSADTRSLLLECGLCIRAEKNGHQAHQQVDCDVSESPDQIFQTLPHWFPIFISTDAKHDQAKARSHPGGKGQRKMMGTGPPPGCSALALVSTWLCPLSASQRAAEWGSIETNSFCRTQLMGLPRPGRKGAAAGLWLLILRRKHARNLPPGICPMTITNPPPPKPTSFSVHTWIHPKIPPHLSPSNHPPTHRAGLVTGEWLVVVHSLVTHKEAEKKREVA